MRTRNIHQGDIFEGPPRKRSHHATRLNGDAATCKSVLDVLRRAGTGRGAMAEEAADAIGTTVDKVQWAFAELKGMGLIRKTESRRTTRKGTLRAVYIVVPQIHKEE